MIILRQDVNLPEFFAKIRRGALLMLDYDGTLAPHVKERMDARPYKGISDKIAAIVDKGMMRVVIISGRKLSDLEILTGDMPRVEMWGSHGLERKDKAGNYSKATLDPALKTALEKTLQKCIQQIPRQQVEAKPFSIALHWRGIDDGETLERIQATVKEWEHRPPHDDLEIHPFDGGVELRPKGRNKGEVVCELLQDVPSGAAVVYLGDDMTDEDAFKALDGRGLKVLVRNEPRATLADLYLKPPEELLDFLEQL